VPPRLISGVLGAVDPRAGSATRVAADTFARLSHGGFAVAGPSGCQIHPLVVQAAALLGAPPAPPGTVAAAAARELAGLLSASPDDYVLAGHARVLADGGEVPDVGATWDLGRLVAGHSERAGDLAQAAARWYRLAETAPDSAADQVAAALACVANGEFGRGIERARRALSLGLTAEQETQARWALAAGLDGLGRFPQADGLWAWLAAGRDPGPARRGRCPRRVM
jgi:hypothetical protein